MAKPASGAAQTTAASASAVFVQTGITTFHLTWCATICMYVVCHASYSKCANFPNNYLRLCKKSCYRIRIDPLVDTRTCSTHVRAQDANFHQLGRVSSASEAGLTSMQSLARSLTRSLIRSLIRAACVIHHSRLYSVMRAVLPKTILPWSIYVPNQNLD